MLFPRATLFRRLLLLCVASWLALNLSSFGQTAPELTGTLPTIVANSSDTVDLDATRYFKAKNVSGSVVQFTFTGGLFKSGTSSTGTATVAIGLDQDATPVSVANFLSYVQSGAYLNSFFHRNGRTESSSLGIVQGGGFRINSGVSPLSKDTLERIPSALPIVNESSASRPNVRGSIAMARTSSVDSATSQWFINTEDNTTSLGGADKAGYTVFGKVLGEGMTVIDQVYAGDTADASKRIDNSIDGAFTALPVSAPLASGSDISVPREDLVVIQSADIIPALTFTAESDDSTIAQVSNISAEGVVTIAPGSTTGTAAITVTATDLDGVATSGTLNVVVQPASTAVVSTGASQLNVSGSAEIATVHVIRSGTAPVTVHYATMDGTALSGTAGADYTGTSGNLIFTANGANDKVVNIPITPGTYPAPGKAFTFQLSVSPGQDAVLGEPSSTTINIVEPGSNPNGVLEFSDSAYQADAGGGFAEVQVVRRGGTSGTVSAVISTQDGGALTGLDYSGVCRMVIFLPGDRIKTVRVPILAGQVGFGNLGFDIYLLYPTGGAELGTLNQTSVGIWELTSDLRKGGVFGFEYPNFRSADTGLATIWVQRLGASGTDTSSVYFTTTNGTGVDGVDYTAVHGLLTFAPTELVKSFTVPILRALVGTEKTIELHLVATSTNATLVRMGKDATLTVTKSVPTGTISFQSSSLTGVAGQPASFTLQRSGSTDQGMSVFVELGNGTAVYGTDYGSNDAIGQSVQVDFAPGSNTADFSVVSATSAALKTVGARISAVSTGYVVGTPSVATLTYAGFTFSPANYRVSASATAAVINVIRSGSSAGSSVTVSAVNGTALAGSDYVATSQVLTFANDETYKTFTVPLMATSGSTDRTLSVHLSPSSSGQVVGPDATLVIAHDPATDVVELASDSFQGVAGNTMTVTLVRTGNTATSINVSLEDGTAVEGTDFGVFDSSYNLLGRFFTATFSSGSTTGVTINTGSGSAGKTFKIRLSSSTPGVAIGARSSAVGGIYSELLAFSPVQYRVGSSGTQVTVTLTRSGTSAEVVDYTTMNGSATAGTDFAATSGPLAFAAGETLKTITIPLLSTGGFTDRAFQVHVSSSNANASSGDAQVIIAHDPATQTVQFDAATYRLASGGPGVTLTRSGTDGTATVTIRVDDGTGALDTDFAVPNVSNRLVNVTFASGSSSAILPITPKNSLFGKSLQLTMLTVSAGMAMQGQTTATVETADRFTFSTDSYRVGAAASQAVLAISRNGTAADESVSFDTVNGTAVAGTDYTQTTGTLTFAAGQTSGTIAVPLLSISGTDDRAFTVHLSSLSADADAGSDATVVIAHDAATDVIEFSPQSYQVSQSGTAVVTLVRTGTAAGSAVIALGNSSAIQGTDYTVTGTSGQFVTVDFPAGSGTAVLNVVTKPNGAGKSLALTLLSTSGSFAAIGARATATVDIVGIAEFSPALYRVAASGSAATLAIVRTGTLADQAVAYQTVDGTAVSGTDFVLTSGTVSFGANETRKLITVPLLTTSGTTDLSFGVHLTSLSPLLTGGTDATVVIAHADATNVVEFNPQSYVVTRSGTAVVTLVRTGTAAGSAVVSLDNSSAIQGADYTITGTSGQTVTVNFPAGSSTAALNVVTTAVADGKSLRMTLLTSDSSSAVGSRSTATIDMAEKVEFSPATYRVAASGTEVTMVIVRTGTSAAEDVAYETVDGTAVSGTDFVLTTGTVTFGANESQKLITVPILATSGSTDLSFGVHLTSFTTLSKVGADATVVIVHAPTTDVVEFSPASFAFDPRTGFDVTLVRTGTTGTRTATVWLLDGSATLGVDYSIPSASGRLVNVTFPAGSGTATLSGTVAISSSGKNFGMRLLTTEAGGGIGAQDTAAVESKGTFNFTADVYPVLATNGKAVVRVKRTRTDIEESVSFATSSGSAEPGIDFVDTSGTLTFAPGESKMDIPVTLLATGSNATRIFTVDLGDPSPTSVLGTIPSIKVEICTTPGAGVLYLGADHYGFDGSKGGKITVYRRGDSVELFVPFEVIDGPAGSGEYSVSPSMLSFAASATAATINVSGSVSSPKNFRIRLQGISGGSAGQWAVGSPAEAVVELGSNGIVEFTPVTHRVMETSGSAVLTVTRTGTTGNVTAAYATANGSAVVGSNYIATSGTLTFAPDETQKLISVPLLVAGGTSTADSSFNVNLLDLSLGTVLGSGSQASVTIVKGATAGVFSFEKTAYRVDVLGGNSAQGIKILRSGTGQAATVYVALQEGDAILDTDYAIYDPIANVRLTGQRVVPVKFAAAESEQWLEVLALSATPKDVVLRLVDASAGSAIGTPNLATVSLIPQGVNGWVEFNFTENQIAESAGTAYVEVSRSGTTAVTVTVPYATVNGTAIAGQHYTATSGTLVFNAGDTQKWIAVPLIATAGTAAPDRNFTVKLLGATGANLGMNNESKVTIVKNAATGTFSMEKRSYDFDTGAYQTFKVLRSGSTSKVASVYVKVLNGTGTFGVDCFTSGTHNDNFIPVSFAANQASATFTLGAVSGTGDRTMSVELIQPSAGSALGKPVSASIRFVDAGFFKFALSSYRVSPSARTAYITVTRSVTTGTATVDFATVDGTAKAGTAYTGTHGRLTFLPKVDAQDIPIACRTVSGPVSFTAKLSNPTGGTVLGTPSQSVVTLDNTAPRGSFRFSASSYKFKAASNDFAGQITVVRSGTAAEIAYVEMVDKTAKLGTDYQLYTDATDYQWYGHIRVVPLTFGAGELTASIRVYCPISVAKTMAARIVSASPGAGIATPATANITIDPPVGPTFSFLDNLSAICHFTESAGSAVLPVQWSGTSGVAGSVRYATTQLTGTNAAVAGVNYVTTSGTLNFQADDTYNYVTVPIKRSSATGDRKFRVNLTGPSAGSSLGTPSGFTVDIVKNPKGGMIWFESSSYRLPTGSRQQIVVRRTNPEPKDTAGVYLALIDNGKIVGGSNVYAVNFTKDQDTVSFYLTGTAGLGDKTVTALLFESSSGCAVAAPNATRITFIDGYYPALVEFAPPAYAVSSNAAQAFVAVTRTRTSGETSIPFTTVNGTAKANIDYISTSGTLTFHAGESVKTFPVDLIANSSGTTNRAFSVRFTAPPTGLAIVGPRNIATVTLNHGTPKGLFSFSSSAYRFDTGKTSAITVVRSGTARPAATVYVACQDGSGVYGADYSSWGRTFAVPFSAGQASATFNITCVSGHGNRTMILRLIGSTPESGIGAVGASGVTFLDVAAAAGVIEFFPTLYTVNASASSATVGIYRTNTSGTVPVRCLLASASAIATTGPIASGTTLTFLPGQRALTFKIPFTAPNVETGVLKLKLSSTAASVGQNSTATITVNKTASAGLFRFSATSYRMVTGATRPISLLRSGTSLASQTVYLEMLDGTGVFGTDYTADNTTGRIVAVTFGVNQTSATFNVRGTSGRGDKNFRARLIGGTGDTGIGSPSIATISLVDANNPNGLVEFSPAAYYITERVGPTSVSLKRSGTSGAVSAVYQTRDGTAKAGKDFVATSGTATFQPGVSVISVPVPVLNNSAIGNSSFSVVLNRVTGGGALGSATTATVTILEAYNANGVFRFEKSAWAFNANSGWAELILTRGSGLAGASDVTVEVKDGSVVSKNVVYRWPNNLNNVTVHFAPGQDRQSLVIPLINGTSSGAFSARITKVS